MCEGYYDCYFNLKRQHINIVKIPTPPNKNMESNYHNLAIWPMLCIDVTTFYVCFFCSTTETAKFDFLAKVKWLTAQINNLS